jgi:putative membrane protein
MHTRRTLYTTLAALVAGTTVVACTTRDRDVAVADSTAAANVPAAAAPVDTTTSAGAVTNENGWTDGQVVAFMDAANNGEIEQGKLAARKATNPAVKAFARQLVADHEAMLKDARALASKKGITPDANRDDVHDLLNDTQDELKDLTDKPAGKDWDEEYLDKQIDGHKDVLNKLQDLEKNTTDPQLKEALNKAVGKVQSHLTKAQDIKDNKLKE